MADDNSPPEWPTGPGIGQDDAASRLDALLNEGANDVAAPAERPARDAGPGPDDTERADGDERAERGERSDEGSDEAVDGEAAAEDVSDDDPAPDFWSAEDKAWWKQVPPELRPVLKKYEAQRIEFANQKAQEAAAERRKAMEEAQKLGSTAEQNVKWWQENHQAFAQEFMDRYAQYTPEVMNRLATENPAEWARVSQARQNAQMLYQQAQAQAQESQRIVQTRQREAFEQSKVAEHAKVAAKLPEYFGTPAKAAKTYEDLGKYLFSKGIPAERINTIHEAPIIEMALNAMRFEQAQKKASTVTSSGAANNPGNAAPKRIEPGPAQQRGNRNGEAIRQVGERFRKSGGADIQDAAELIRLKGF